MEVRDAVKEKERLEQTILGLLSDFQEKTGTSIERIDLSVEGVMSSNHPVIFGVSIKVVI